MWHVTYSKSASAKAPFKRPVAKSAIFRDVFHGVNYPAQIGRDNVVICRMPVASGLARRGWQLSLTG